METRAVSYPSDLPHDDDCCTPDELRKKIETGEDFVLLDVRTPEELEYAHLHCCTHIPLNELPERIRELEGSRGKEIITLCHHGMRSEMAQEFLKEQGFENVRNLRGGIDAYAAEADETVGRY